MHNIFQNQKISLFIIYYKLTLIENVYKKLYHKIISQYHKIYIILFIKISYNGLDIYECFQQLSRDVV